MQALLRSYIEYAYSGSYSLGLHPPLPRSDLLVIL
eukprot:COSAG01_NODE_4262_length_5199_cov_16.571569_6_plen_35_part_00